MANVETYEITCLYSIVAETSPLLQGGNVVVVQQPVQSSPPKFRDYPIDLVDDKGNRYTTEVRYVNGLLTWVAVGITCLVAGIYTYYCVSFRHSGKSGQSRVLGMWGAPNLRHFCCS